MSLYSTFLKNLQTAQMSPNMVIDPLRVAYHNTVSSTNQAQKLINELQRIVNDATRPKADRESAWKHAQSIMLMSGIPAYQPLTDPKLKVDDVTEPTDPKKAQDTKKWIWIGGSVLLVLIIVSIIIFRNR